MLASCDPAPLPASAWVGPHLQVPGQLFDWDDPLIDPHALPAPLARASDHRTRRRARREEATARLLALGQAHRDLSQAAGPGRGDRARLAQLRRLEAGLALAWCQLAHPWPPQPRPMPPVPPGRLWYELRLRPAHVLPRALEGLPFAASAAAAAAVGLPVARPVAATGGREVALWAVFEGELERRPVAVSGQLPVGSDGQPRAVAAPDGGYFADYCRLEEACLKLAGAAGAPPWCWGGGRSNDVALAGAMAALTGGRPFSLSCASQAQGVQAFVRAYLDDPLRPAVVTFSPPGALAGAPVPLMQAPEGAGLEGRQDSGGQPAAAGWLHAGVPHAVLRRSAGSPRLTLIDPLRSSPDPVAWYGTLPPPPGRGVAPGRCPEIERTSLGDLGARLWGVMAEDDGPHQKGASLLKNRGLAA